MKSYTEIHKLHNFFADTHPFIFYLFFCNFDTQIFKFSNLSLELHDVPIFWWEPDTSGTFFFFFFFFFYQGFLSRTLTTHRTAGEGRGPSYSTLPLPPAHEHSDTYLQLCIWDDYHIFLIATLVFTRLLLDEIYRLIELLFDWLMM